MVTENGILKKEVSDQMKLIWSDPSVKKCAERGAEYGLIESTIYYLNALNRIADPNYWPTVQDILHSRSRTTGIIETKFSFKVSFFFFCIFWSVLGQTLNNLSLSLGFGHSHDGRWRPTFRTQKMASLF